MRTGRAMCGALRATAFSTGTSSSLGPHTDPVRRWLGLACVLAGEATDAHEAPRPGGGGPPPARASTPALCPVTHQGHSSHRLSLPQQKPFWPSGCKPGLCQELARLTVLPSSLANAGQLECLSPLPARRQR